MQRRLFLKSLLQTISALPLITLARKTDAASKRGHNEILLQTSPLAGFQFYEGSRLWTSLRPNDILQLIAEPDNPYDEQAVNVMWHSCQLGYVPRQDNTAVSQLLQRQKPLVARIAELKYSPNPWERVSLNIYLAQG